LSLTALKPEPICDLLLLLSSFGERKNLISKFVYANIREPLDNPRERQSIITLIVFSEIA
jgi:hypothetical protein